MVKKEITKTWLTGQHSCTLIIPKRRGKYESLPGEIEFIVKKNMTSFIQTIISLSSTKKYRIILEDNKKTYDGGEFDLEKLLPEKWKGHPDYSYFFPIQSLRKDQKFISLLKGIKQEFDEGYNEFIQ